MKAAVLSPSAIVETLHALYPETIRAHLQGCGLEMLRDLYQKMPSDPKVHQAQLAMETALSKWGDEQVADFLLNYLFDPPYSTELQSKSPAELRQILAGVYDFLFLDLPGPEQE